MNMHRKCRFLYTTCALALAGCVSDPAPSPQPPITNASSADLARRVAMDQAAVQQVIDQGRMFLWALGIGGVVGLLGLALVVAAVVFRLGRNAMLAGAGMILFSVVVCSVSIAFPHHGETIASIAAVCVGLALATAAVGVGLLVRHLYRALTQVVSVAEEAKTRMCDESRAEVFGDGGIADATMDPKTKAIVAKKRKSIKENA